MLGIINLLPKLSKARLIADNQLKEIEELFLEYPSRQQAELLVEYNYINKDVLEDFLVNQLEIKIFNLSKHDFDDKLIKLLPENQARRLQAIVIDSQNDHLVIGLTRPNDIFIQDELSELLDYQVIETVFVWESELLQALKTVYRRPDQIDTYAEVLSTSIQDNNFDSNLLEERDTPVGRLLNSIFDDALRMNASDIHIEPDKDILRIRQRVDGLLHEHIVNDVRIAAALTQKLKIMASLDIAERRLPQDGVFSLEQNHEIFDVRISTMPLQYGESIVMRLLRRSNIIHDLQYIGMSDELRLAVNNQLNRSYGLILVTGPTGSGKTTTLYSMLQILNKEDKKIITVEDPVEYHISRINQVQVNNKIGLNFARILRSILRQDPDVIMLGEIRDQETAEIAVRAAMTGHLVLATLHTHDTSSAIVRLHDMGVPNYLLAASIRAVLAQRLLRKVCKYCAKSSVFTTEEKIRVNAFWLEHGLPALSWDSNARHIYGLGCNNCNKTGYAGRVCIYEWLDLDNNTLSLLQLDKYEQFKEALVKKTAGKLLLHDAWHQVNKGHTSLLEWYRIAGE